MDRDQLKELFRDYIRQSINPNDKTSDVDTNLKIEDKDWDMLMFLYEKKKSQILQELDIIAVLGALKQYANGIECGTYASNSKLNIDNFEHELDDYFLNNW